MRAHEIYLFIWLLNVEVRIYLSFYLFIHYLLKL